MATPSRRTVLSGDTERPKRRTLWAAVRDDLERRIHAGEFTETFPGEFELSEEYGVSRSTIRAALAPLRRQGLISAQPGRPSHVVHVAQEHSFGPIYSLFAAVQQAGMTQRSAIEAAEVGKEPAVAERLGLDPDSDLIHIVRRRFADDEPFAIDQVWLRPEARGVLDVDLTHTALYEALIRCCGLTLTSGEETLHSINLSSEQALRLSCATGAAAFYIERLGKVDDRPLEWRETLVRGDRFTVTTSYP